MRREHKRGKHVTLQLLHLEYKRAHPDGWGYTQFCRHYQQWLEHQYVVMRLEDAAGERMFVDFAGDTMPITNPETGEVRDAQIFVSVDVASLGPRVCAGALRLDLAPVPRAAPFLFHVRTHRSRLDVFGKTEAAEQRGVGEECDLVDLAAAQGEHHHAPGLGA